MRRYAASLQPDEVNLLSQFLQEELDRRHLTRCCGGETGSKNLQSLPGGALETWKTCAN
jgi:hypothetical protein